MSGYPGRAEALALGVVCALSLFAPASAKPPPPAPIAAPAPQSASPQQIDDVERAFGQAVAQQGIGPGFRQFAAPDAVMFLPDPVAAGQELAGAHWPGDLFWRAQYVGVAPSGDLAFSAGPSLLRGAGRPSGGYYLTVWKRQPDGSWKFVLDHAVDMPPAVWSALSRPLQVMGADAPAGPPSNEGLREADGALNAALPKGAASAFGDRVDEQILLMRTNRPVAQGRRKALALVMDSPPILEASTLGGGRAMDGSLGYAYGRARWTTPAGAKAGYYVRIWRATPQGWRLLADQLAER